MDKSQAVHFGKYTILHKIATGGMAELYMGKITGDQGFEKLVCIKKIHPHLAGDDQLVKSFIDEAKLAAYLNHENIVQIYDFGNMEGAYFITMEYLFGKDLREIVNKAKTMKLPISLENALHIVTRICAGLDYAHRLKNFQGRPLNIIHRDISPPNIFVTYDGQVKIIDFGIAKAASMDETTQFGLVKGKAAYMSPEQADGKAIDYRSDLFSTGILLYEMITGKRMYEGETLDIIARAKNAEFEPPENIVKDLHPSLLHILKRVLSKDVDKRYQSGGEMQRDLEECIYQLSLRPTAVTVGRYMTMLFREETLGEERVMRSIARGSSFEDIEEGIIEGTQPYLVESFGKNGVEQNYEKTVVLRRGIWSRITGLRVLLASLGLVLLLVIGLAIVFLSKEDTTITKLNEGFRALDVNDFQQAEIIFKEVLKEDASLKGLINEEYSRALLSRAIQIQENDLKTAEQMLTKAVELDPDNSKLYYSLGSLYSETGNHPMAIEMLKKVDSKSEEFPEALMSLGRIYEKGNDLANAEEIYTQLVELAPPFLDEALIRLARVQEKKGELDKSIISLTQATMINPENKIAEKLLERIRKKLEGK